MEPQRLLQALKSGEMGFCAGLATLLVILPPNFNEWLAGGLEQGTIIMLLAGTTAVVQGLVGFVNRLLKGGNNAGE